MVLQVVLQFWKMVALERLKAYWWFNFLVNTQLFTFILKFFGSYYIFLHTLLFFPRSIHDNSVITNLCPARANLSRGIREAKRQYSQEDSPSFQWQQRHSEPVGRGFRPLRTTSPTTDLWTAPSPCWTSWMPSLLALRHKNSTTAQKTPPPPGDQMMTLSPHSVRRSSAGSMHAKLRVLTTFLGVYWETVQWNSLMFHRHFQHLTKPGCCPHMLQSYHHHSSPEEVISILLQWLPSSSTHSYSHEVLWTVSHAAHQVCPPPLPGPLPVCI